MSTLSKKIQIYLGRKPNFGTEVKIQDDGFLFKLNIVQFIIFPFRVFNNENEIRFLKSILNRKGYVK